MAPVGDASLRPAGLRCEYLANPLGIGETRPRLSWLLESGVRGQRQTAYHILVASNPRLLRPGRADLWDSGQVPSDDTTAIVYGGKPLSAGLRCHWKVRVWDKDGNPPYGGQWSTPALWSMGLLQPAGKTAQRELRPPWRADWIGYDKPRDIPLPDAPFEGAKWIWFGGDQGPNFPKGPRVFMATLELPPDAEVAKAELLVTADDKYSFELNGEQMAASEPVPESWKRPQIRDLTERIKPGSNTVRVRVDNDSDGPAGLLLKLVVTTADGLTRTLVSDESWRATDQPGENWHSRPIAPDAWPHVQVVGDYGVAPWGRLKGAQLYLPPAVHLRTSFRVAKKVKQATLYATAFGWFDARLNGRRVSDTYFDPGWTDYAKRVYARAYDVTKLLRQGENALGAVLADGWFSGYIGWGHIRDHYGKRPRFRAQLHVEYADGTSDLIATSPAWRAAAGPILEADILMGETYDARQEIPGWDKPRFDEQSWTAVDVGAELSPTVEPHPGPPVIAIQEFRARSITRPKPGVWVLDMGQNFAGVARLTVQGKPGQKITLRFAERLNPDGTLYTTNLRTARATDTYICKGRNVGRPAGAAKDPSRRDGLLTEVWQPRFTFHGFQFVEVTGLAKRPTKDTVVGVALSSDTPAVGSFHCSDPMLNQLHSNIYWTQRANFIDVPTDCPQRDERLGWTGDAQAYIRAASLNCDVQAFFTKWLVDLDDAQRADGQFPMVAPLKGAGPDGGPAWADAGVICPWTLYQVYGDRRILERHYDAMARFVAFCKSRCTPDLLPPAQFHCFGDWLSIDADTPRDVILAAYFALSTRLTAGAAEALGKTDDAAKYSDLADAIKAAFNRAYVAPDGRVKGDTQTAYVLALAFDLLDGGTRELAARHLVENIKARGWRLSTGFVGTKDLMLSLAQIGRNDVAYRLIHSDKFPSWGFSIQHGATSIWERWDGWTPDRGFQDPGMNSFAHCAFGAVYQWMAENIGGIRAVTPGYKHFLVAPTPGVGAGPRARPGQPQGAAPTEARVGYRCIHGLIESHWELAKGKLLLDVTVPPNTTATVIIPTRQPSGLTERGKPLAKAPGVKLLRSDRRCAVVEVQSGRYRFASQCKPRKSGT